MLTTTEEIQALFNQMVSQKHKAGLTRQQAEVVSCRQIAYDAMAGEIDPTAARAFIIGVEVAKGGTREVASILVDSLFAGKPHTFTERPDAITQAVKTETPAA
jgi:hypothetical protein